MNPCTYVQQGVCIIVLQSLLGDMFACHCQMMRFLVSAGAKVSISAACLGRVCICANAFQMYTIEYAHVCACVIAYVCVFVSLWYCKRVGCQCTSGLLCIHLHEYAHMWRYVCTNECQQVCVCIGLQWFASAGECASLRR